MPAAAQRYDHRQRAEADRARLVGSYHHIRATTERLAEPLSAEDQALQSTTQCSPTKWHRAHTTWFFETFVLGPHGVEPFDSRWSYLFNSYYEAVGPRHARPWRGMLSRPAAAEITEYRRVVDERVAELLATLDEDAWAELRPVFELGLAHEQQHQELILTDILSAFARNPLRPAYRRDGSAPVPSSQPATPLRFIHYGGGLVEIGAAPGGGFHFDNEGPRHRTWLDPFELSDRLVTVGEWKAFTEAGGYQTPSLWLSEGIDWVRANDVQAPRYARREGTALVVFGLDGEREASDAEPVTHVSLFEADAIARFLGARLATEAEWEVAAAALSLEGNFLDTGALRAAPAVATRRVVPAQLYGDAWEWTQSSYGPYPGYTPPSGALGEYNGKFMVNQVVLRGGSCFTPSAHLRPTYRNFWHPDTRSQMTGIRLARSQKG